MKRQAEVTEFWTVSAAMRSATHAASITTLTTAKKIAAGKTLTPARTGGRQGRRGETGRKV